MSIPDEQSAHFEGLREQFIMEEGAKTGNWFSLQAAKINGKIFAAQWHNGDLIIKLPPDQIERILQQESIHLFQPMPDRSPMKQWAQIPYVGYLDEWERWMRAAYEYVRDLTETK